MQVALDNKNTCLMHKCTCKIYKPL